MKRVFRAVLGVLAATPLLVGARHDGCGGSIDMSNVENMEGAVRYTAAISGTVEDSTTHRGISGALVRVEDKSATTDRSGMFHVAAVGVGEQAVSVEASGYHSLTTIVTLEKGANAIGSLLLFKSEEDEEGSGSGNDVLDENLDNGSDGGGQNPGVCYLDPQRADGYAWGNNDAPAACSPSETDWTSSKRRFGEWECRYVHDAHGNLQSAHCSDCTTDYICAYEDANDSKGRFVCTAIREFRAQCTDDWRTQDGSWTLRECGCMNHHLCNLPWNSDWENVDEATELGTVRERLQMRQREYEVFYGGTYGTWTCQDYYDTLGVLLGASCTDGNLTYYCGRGPLHFACSLIESDYSHGVDVWDLETNDLLTCEAGGNPWVDHDVAISCVGDGDWPQRRICGEASSTTPSQAGAQ